MEQPFADRDLTAQAFADHVNRGKVTLYAELGLDIIMGERNGPWFHDAFDPDRRWLDCHCNGGVHSLGHRNPQILSAVRDALGHIDIGNHHLVSGLRAELARRLSLTTGDRLPGVVFGVGGGEAVDLALKMARAHTGRQGIVSAIGGYHGSTGLSMAAGDAQYRDPFGPSPEGFAHVPFGDLDAIAAAVGDETAAVILEPIPATLGMVIPPPGYLREVSALCRDAGAMLVLDEIQTGLGRTGSLWYHTQEDVEPDLVVAGKALSGGIYPITATLMTAELHAFFDTHPFAHVSTFGGAELGCVAALTALDIIEEPGFLERVRSVGEQIESALAGPGVEVRRRGMFTGLRFDDPNGGVAAAQHLIGAGVFAVFANHDLSVLQFLPPLTISDDELDWLLTTTLAALAP